MLPNAAARGLFQQIPRHVSRRTDVIRAAAVERYLEFNVNPFLGPGQALAVAEELALNDRDGATSVPIAADNVVD
jgi:hypothetical protein